MRPRRLTPWQWAETLAVAIPAFLIVPLSGLVVLTGLVAAASFLTPGSLADLGWSPLMATLLGLWLPAVGLVAYPALLVAIAFGPRRVCARPALKWAVVACGVAGIVAVAVLLKEPSGDTLWGRLFGLAVFGLPGAIGLRYLWLLLTTRLSPEERLALRSRPRSLAPAPPALPPPTLDPPRRRPAPRRSLKPLLKLAGVLASLVLLATGAVVARALWPKPDGVHPSYYLWAGDEFFWGRKERLRAETPYLDGKRHGVETIYHRATGQRTEERTWAAGRLHGPSKTYRFRRPGVVESVTMFERGVRLWTRSYTKEGDLRREVEYLEGKDRVRYVNYDRLGRVVEEGTRRGGWTLESVTTTYGPDGTVLTRTRYRHKEGRTALPVAPGTNETDRD